MAKATSMKVRNGHDRRFRREHLELCKKLRDKEFRTKALDFLMKEIKHHYGGKIDVVASPMRCRFFSQLAAKMKSEVRTLMRKRPHFGDGKILQVQQYAGSRDDLITIRERIRSANGGVRKDQFTTVAVTIFSSRSAIEIGGDPVVSINHGCPVCGTHI